MELAGQIRELASRSLNHDFRTIDPQGVRVVLVDGGKEPLANFGDNLSARARSQLEKMGVELQMGYKWSASTPSASTSKTPEANGPGQLQHGYLGSRRPSLSTRRPSGEGHRGGDGQGGPDRRGMPI